MLHCIDNANMIRNIDRERRRDKLRERERKRAEMDESAISSVLSRLGNFNLSETKFLSDVPSKLKNIETKLRTVYGYLKDSVKKFEPGQLDQPDWLCEIKAVAYQYENCIEKIAWLQRRRNRKRGFIGTLSMYAQTLSDLKTLHHVGTEIDQINNKIPEISQIKEQFSVCEEGECSTNERSIDDELYQTLAERTISHDEDFVVGLENNLDEILEQLTDPDHKEVTTISISGISGLGKSTLAKKVFNHPTVKSNFNTCSWIKVSKSHQITDILREILCNTVGLGKEELDKMKDDEARKKIYEHLKEKKYLIVLDEIWTTMLWNDIFSDGVTFPDMNDGSRIIFTTQSEDVADNADITHELEHFDDEKSWELLKWIVFPSNQTFDEKTLNDLESLGRELAKKCDGLPLALVILGGYLSKNLDHETWSKVASALDSEEIETETNIQEIIALCYNDLPNCLKPCFLYTASFPEDNDIKASKLIKLWIAEGFISPNEKYSMEETARIYINQLKERQMVQIVDLSTTHGWVNRIKIHDLLCEWGVAKARNEGFLDVWIGRDRATSSQKTLFYRVALHSFFDEEISKCVPNLRTLLTFDLPETNLILHGLNFLRVLDLNGTYHIKRLPKWIKHMIHLRYLGLKDCSYIELPSSIGSLLNLITFDATDTTIRNLPHSFWSIPALKHVKIGTVKYSKTPNLGRPNGISTLSLAVSSDDASHFDCHVMRKSVVISVVESLPLMTQLNSLFLLSNEEIPVEAITTLSGNNHLEVLKLIGTLLGQTKLPNTSLFPPNLIKLSLMFTGLSEDPLPILELLPNLIVLEMCDVYNGSSLSCSQIGFPKLKHLYLTMFLQVVEWNIERGAMASLSHLRLIQFVEMTEMPVGLNFLTSLKMLEMVEMHELSGDNLKRLEENGCEVIQRDCLDSNGESNATQDYSTHEEVL